MLFALVSWSWQYIPGGVAVRACCRLHPFLCLSHWSSGSTAWWSGSARRLPCCIPFSVYNIHQYGTVALFGAKKRTSDPYFGPQKVPSRQPSMREKNFRAYTGTLIPTVWLCSGSVPGALFPQCSAACQTLLRPRSRRWSETAHLDRAGGGSRIQTLLTEEFESTPLLRAIEVGLGCVATVAIVRHATRR
jgi:hypothetical protein